MKGLLKAMTALLALAAMCLTLSSPVLASSPSAVEPAQELAVYVRVNDQDLLLHTYTLGELQALAQGREVHYSGIDSMPCPLVSVANGVYLSDLLDDAQQYSDYRLSDYKYLRTKSTDGATGRFSEDELFGDRYYYPGLHASNGAWNAEEAEVDMSKLGSGVRVEPMLSISAQQNRLPDPGSGDSRDYQPESFTLLFGVSDAELANCIQRVSQYRRGVYQLRVDMGTLAIPVAVSGLSLDRSSLALSVGGDQQLTALITPANASDDRVVWSSSDGAVAMVSATGVVRAIGVGQATITASSHEDPTYSASCVLTVSASQVAVSGVSLSRGSLTLELGGSRRLSALVLPATASDRTLSWSSSDEDVAEVDDDGLVTAKAVGEADIRVTTNDGDFSDSCRLSVSERAVALSGLSLSRSFLTLARGSEYQLQVELSPDNASDVELVWSSDAPGIVGVDTAGLLSARNLGLALISVSSTDTDYTASCTVTVAEQAAAFSDISGSWAKAYIEDLAADGYIGGYRDGSFRPDAYITRAEFISILVRILQAGSGLQINASHVFPDSATHWAREQISTAVAAGLSSGYGNGNFGPDDQITREQIAVLLCNAVNGDGSQLNAGFTDSATISAWAKPAVAYAKEQGWVSGYGDGSFGPQRKASRGEVCAMLQRFCDQYE